MGRTIFANFIKSCNTNFFKSSAPVNSHTSNHKTVKLVDTRKPKKNELKLIFPTDHVVRNIRNISFRNNLKGRRERYNEGPIKPILPPIKSIKPNNRREYNTQPNVDLSKLEKSLAMRKVFWDNPYQHTLMTTIASIDATKVTFNETIAYSFSGGQESDKATVNGIPILDSKMEGNLIYYTLPEGHGLTTGQEVKMEIDWTRRYRLMRLHFAAELVLEIVTQKFKLEKVGARITESKSRVDFLYMQHISCLFDDILKEYHQIIEANKIIEVGYTNVKNQRRYWKIADYAQVPCGGTHVLSTAEVGHVTLKRARGGKSVERIEIIPVDNSVPECTFFAYKKYQPGLPVGLNYVKVESKSNGLFESLSIYLNEDHIQLQNSIIQYKNQHAEKLANNFTEILLASMCGIDLDIEFEDLKSIYALSQTKQRQIVVVISGGAQVINHMRFPNSSPIFIYYTGQKQFNGLKLTGEKQALDILKVLDQKYNIFVDSLSLRQSILKI